MATIDTSSFSPVITANSTTKASAAKTGTDAIDSADVAAAQTNEPQISEQAKTLSSLYASASDYVKSEHLEAFSGYSHGLVSPGGYIDVGKYNDYLFGKAATSMVATAKENGISLNKDDVIAQLKSDNSDIAKIKFSDQDRISKLGSNSVLSNLSASDIDSLTSTYITAKESDLSSDEVKGLAIQKGVKNLYGSTLQEGDTYPYNWDSNENDPDKIAAAKFQLPQAITDKANEIKNKIIGDLGLGSDFLKFLLDPKNGLKGATDSSLEFLSKLADIYNEQKEN